VEAQTPHGDSLGALRAALHHPDPSQLWYQLKEIVQDRAYLQHGVHVEEGDVVLDVGANVGVAALFFALECRAGTVHCFEPVAPVFELLHRNVRDVSACVPHPYGLSSACRHAPITYYPGAAAMSGLYANPEEDRELVRTCLLNLGVDAPEADARLAGRYEPEILSCELRTLSAVIGELSLARVDLLKVDVEKAELDVLQGIEDSDWPVIRQVVAEVHDEGGRLPAVKQMLAERGFALAIEQEPAMRRTPVHVVYARRR
jgi:FkbM family methyltransferase